MNRSSWLVLTLVLFASAVHGAPGGTLLTVRVPGNSDYNYTLAQLQRFPERTVSAHGQGGEEHSYTGVALGDLLRDAGTPGGADLHGRYLQYYALAQARDRYSVVFALPELDPAYMDKTVLVAWARDGQPLPAEEGPLAIVVPDDKHPARWVRQLRRVDVHVDGPYSFPTEPDLEKITQELLDAASRGDKEPWLQYVDEDCLFTTADGQTLTRKELVEQIQPFPAGYSGTLKMANPKVRSYGTTAVITYDALEEEMIYGQILKTRYHTTDTYLFRFGHWRMIASQGMAVPKDPPLARVDPKVYDAYAGTYELAPGVIYTVTREGAKLFGQRSGTPRQELLPEAEDRFFLHGVRGVKIFVRDQGGRAIRLLDRRDGNDLVWKRQPG
jgi:DMSO/TMAO reductase YedYZ molybdopterin-dependent catalytic subunit